MVTRPVAGRIHSCAGKARSDQWRPAGPGRPPAGVDTVAPQHLWTTEENADQWSADNYLLPGYRHRARPEGDLQTSPEMAKPDPFRASGQNRLPPDVRALPGRG